MSIFFTKFINSQNINDHSIIEANKCEAYKKEHAYTDTAEMYDGKK